jgi:tetratricopeptide (TPR) repeat protein
LCVDNQLFPNYTQKIQLNHYFCRSTSELEKKINRGRGDMGDSWPRRRFEITNLQATYPDASALELIKRLVGAEPPVLPGGKSAYEQGWLLEQMVGAAQMRSAKPANLAHSNEVFCRPQVTAQVEMVKALAAADARGDQPETIRLLMEMIRVNPTRVSSYAAMAIIYLRMNDAPSAWQALAQAWRLAPPSFLTLKGMVHYFLHVKNFEMAEKTCRLLLDIAPHDLTALGFMTEVMIGQGRFEEALKIGTPVVELAGIVGELPERFSIFLVKKMADYLVQQHDYARAAHLWEAGAKSQARDVNVLLEWINVLQLNGDLAMARQVLAQARVLAPQKGEVLRKQRQLNQLSNTKKQGRH